MMKYEICLDMLLFIILFSVISLNYKFEITQKDDVVVKEDDDDDS